MEKALLRIDEYAELVSLGRSKVYELIARGDIRVVRVGRAVRIPAGEVARFAERLTAEQIGQGQ